MDDKDLKRIIMKMYHELYGKDEGTIDQDMSEEELKKRYELIKSKLAKTGKRRLNIDISNEEEASEFLKMIMQVSLLLKKHHLI